MRRRATEPGGASFFSPPMNAHEFAESILLNLPFDPNDQQVQLIAALARYCSPATPDETAFVLNGYAGTGKTSVVGALVRSLLQIRVPVALLAPTGRAAKVFAQHAGHSAYTIHRRIYRGADGGEPEVALNARPGTVFIVDEASMIGDGGHDAATSLLDDLIQHVFSADGCRLVLLGDTAQLPPVGCEASPAMNPDALRQRGLKVVRVTLTEVVRQASGSGILYNATWLRRAMLMKQLPPPQVKLRGFRDISAVPSEELQDAVEHSYATSGPDRTIVITRANWRATQFNLAIRSEILGREEELCRDERLLVTKNNYLWGAKVRGLDFIANGDVAVVESIRSTESRYGLRFADVRLRLPDHDVELDCKIILDPLTSDTPSLAAEAAQKLWQEALTDPDVYDAAMPMTARIRASRTNPWLNALQVKYAYAVTCHKAQGGQWDDVFVDMSGIGSDAMGLEFYRWLYTSFTRATRHLHLINPSVRLVE